jgi:tRNA dimethylallyltransferase
MDERPFVLLGSTASGKTEVSLPLAEMLGAEIVSVDSRQIFRGMEIGSASPTPEERRRVRHHLVAEVDPGNGMSAGEFGRRARAAMAELRGRGRVPILVGGSGLYLRAALGGLDEHLPRDPRVQEGLRERLRAEGAEALHAELERRDPETAARLSPKDGQRIARALEILAISGKRPSALRTQGRSAEAQARIAVLDRSREDLETRIRRRVDLMVTKGLAEEVRALLAQGLDPATPILKSVGYAETIRYLRGEIDRAEWIESVVGNTRRFAKRQRTWFRGLAGAAWTTVSPTAPAEAIASGIAGSWGAG